MSNNSNPNYFRLGLFVLAAIGALIALILIFGSGQMFQKSFLIETYLEQSVTGLDKGAAVRFRGVKIGQVVSIQLSGLLYEEEVPITARKEYVVVRMRIDGDPGKLLGEVNNYVAADLRLSVKSMGITGVNYIELDYVKRPNTKQNLLYTWKPDYPVIPSLPNQTDEIFAGIQKFLGIVNKLDLAETQKKFDLLLANLNTLMSGNGKENAGLVKSVEELNLLLARIDKVTNNDELNVLMGELIGAVTSLRQTVTTIQGDTSFTVENLRQASEHLNELSRIASRSPSSLIWSEPPPRITPPMNGSQVSTDTGVKK